MRIVVSGAAGFLGRPVCAALAEHDVLAIVRSQPIASLPANCRVEIGDLNDVESCRRAVMAFRPDAAVHLAWSGLPDYSLAACTRNFQASLNFLNTVRDSGCRRVVVAGTCWEYGPLTGCLAEDRIPESVGQFAAFKTALRLAGESLLTTTGNSLLWARIFFVYGAGQRSESLIPSVYRSLQRGQSPEIRTPAVINDFVYVDDVAAGLASLATSTASAGNYNLGSGQPTQVREVANLVAQAMGKSPIYTGAEEPGQGAWADLTKVRTCLGWQPRVGLREGIERTIAQWRAAP